MDNWQSICCIVIIVVMLTLSGLQQQYLNLVLQAALQEALFTMSQCMYLLRLLLQP